MDYTKVPINSLHGGKYTPKRVPPYKLENKKFFKFLSVFDRSIRNGWDILIHAYLFSKEKIAKLMYQRMDELVNRYYG